MKSGKIVAVVAVLFSLTGAAFASSVGGGFDWGGLYVNQNLGYWDDGRANFSAYVSSEVHRVENANTYITKDWWTAPNGTPGILAQVTIWGVLDKALNKRSVGNNFNYNHNGLRFNQYSSLYYSSWPESDGGLIEQNSGSAGGWIEGVTWRSSDAQYYEWSSTIGKGAALPTTETGFQWNFLFHGYFEDAAVAKQYFGTSVPEPTSLGLLAAGTALVARRRRRFVG